MHISQLHLRNFRLFKEAHLKLHPRLCVFVGDNGNGKSSLLDAMAIAISRIFPYCDYVPRIVPIAYTSTNYRRYCEQVKGCVRERICADSRVAVEISGLGTRGTACCTALACGRSIRSLLSTQERENDMWDTARRLAGERTLAKCLNQLAEEGRAIPALAYYGPHRGAQQGERRHSGRRKLNFTNPFAAYINALQPKMDFEAFLAWFSDAETAELREQRKHPDYRSPEMDAVREALRRVFSGSEVKLSNPHFTSNPELFVMDRVLPDGSANELSFDRLSDGYRSMVALVADFARRLAICGRYAGENPLDGEGILLIDEIDAHLHPKWQYRVVADLRRTFPNAQLIISTHSAEVLTSVKSESIYLLTSQDDGVLEERHPEYETYGYYPDSIATDVMDTPELFRDTPGFQAYLSCLAMLQKHLADSETYRSERTKVATQFGEASPLIHELDRREEGARRALSLRMRLGIN